MGNECKKCSQCTEERELIVGPQICEECGFLVKSNHWYPEIICIGIKDDYNEHYVLHSIKKNRPVGYHIASVYHTPGTRTSNGYINVVYQANTVLQEKVPKLEKEVNDND